uniref:Uncharacterized protein n=1 Tax=viral metagenome TaxID=1070528 RepID=A0A6M3L1W6_9ZZZZ
MKTLIDSWKKVVTLERLLRDEVGIKGPHTNIELLEAVLGRLVSSREQIQILKSGAPVIKCCEHCEICKAEAEDENA